MSMKLKKAMTISRVRRHTSFGPIDSNICMRGGVADEINCANFYEHQYRDPGAERP